MPGLRRRVLVLGSGGREHALVRALATSPECDVFCAPGNPGIAEHATLWPIALSALPELVATAWAERIDLVIPGPEAVLDRGIADALAEVHIPCCGPSRAASQLEASKAFMRRLTAPLCLPAPAFRIVESVEELAPAIESFARVPVLKADGLAAGKGVFLPTDAGQCLALGRLLLDGALGLAGRRLVLEERLSGPEVSLFFACHGTSYVALPSARDHKRLLAGGVGPNTGGMGAVSPCPAIVPSFVEQAGSIFVAPTLQALLRRGTPYVGFLYLGLILTAAGPRLLEFNVRLGDPEAQAILPRLAPGELLRLCTATATANESPRSAGSGLAALRLQTLPGATCAVVLAAPGYPDEPRLGGLITIDAGRLQQAGVTLFHNGTQRMVGAPALQVAGGRVLTIVGHGADLAAARRSAYRGVAAIDFPGMQQRDDIGLPNSHSGTRQSDIPSDIPDANR